MGLQELEERLALAREGGDAKTAANLLFRIGVARSRGGEPDRALEAFQEAYLTCKASGNDQGRLTVLKRVVGLMIDQGRMEEAAQGLGTGFELASKLADLSSRVELLGLSARISLARGRLEEAARSLLGAVDICRDHGDRIGELLTLERLGPILRQAGRTEPALEVYSRMAELAREAGDAARQALALVGVGQLNGSLGRPAEALENLKTAEALYLRAGLKIWAEMVGQEIDRLSADGPGGTGSDPGPGEN